MTEAEQLFRLVDVLGVIANALLAGRVARSMRFDAVGFIVLGVMSGLGGGMVRDVLLNVRPVALTDPAYLVSALAASLVAYLLTIDGRWTVRALTVADILALGAWSATGAVKGLAAGLDVLPAMFLGVVTAVGGGSIRDIAVGQVPAIFRAGTPLYATIAAVCSLEMALVARAGHADIGMGLSIVTAAVLGTLARRRGWGLPAPLDIAPTAQVRQRLKARRPTRRKRRPQR